MEYPCNLSLCQYLHGPLPYANYYTIKAKAATPEPKPTVGEGEPTPGIIGNDLDDAPQVVRILLQVGVTCGRSNHFSKAREIPRRPRCRSVLPGVAEAGHWDRETPFPGIRRCEVAQPEDGCVVEGWLVPSHWALSEHVRCKNRSLPAWKLCLAEEQCLVFGLHLLAFRPPRS